MLAWLTGALGRLSSSRCLDPGCTGPGIYHGQISYSSQEPGDGVIESAQLLPYPARQGEESPFHPGQERLVPEVPLSLAFTEFHFILLYEDRIRVIRTLDDHIVHEEMLELVRVEISLFAAFLFLTRVAQPPGERIRAIASDPVKRTFWLYSDAAIFELSVRDEDREMWEVHLDRQAYDVALKFAKVRTGDGDAVSSSRYSSGRTDATAARHRDERKGRRLLRPAPLRPGR
jgi:hypothetical protein